MPRFVLYVLITVMVAAIGVAGSLKLRSSNELSDAIDATGLAVRAIEQEIRMHTALASANDASLAAAPKSIEPSWFETDRPLNHLLDVSRPWVEIAKDEDRSRMHPRVVIATGSTDAAFWYNPRRGIVRARVPSGMSDQAAIEIYNRINGASIRTPFPSQ